MITFILVVNLRFNHIQIFIQDLMRKLFFYFIMLVSVNAFSQNKVTLSGTVDKAASETLTVTNDMYFLGSKQEVYTSPVTGGKFSLSFELDHSRILTLNYKDQVLPLYIEPGDSLDVSFDASALMTTVQVKGKGAVHNQFLIKFNNLFRENFSKPVMDEKIKTSSVDAFEMTLFSNKKKQSGFYNEFPEKKYFTAAFRSYIENAIKYNYWNYILAYPIVTANLNKGLTVAALPAVMLESFDRNSVTNDTALISDAYRSFLTYYVTYFTSEANGFNKFTDYSVSMQKKYMFANQHLKGESLRYFLAKYLVDECLKASSETVKKVYNVLAWADNNGMYSKIANEKCGTWMNTKAPTGGDAVATMKLKDINGKDRTLASFKGKVVYIDFWASWCGPCRQQFPFAKELMGKLTEKQKKQVEFVYISIDDTDELWKRGIEANRLEGIQLHSPGGWKSEVVKAFKITGIPRYMLINKKGEIVNENAMRPSQPEILNEIVKLL